MAKHLRILVVEDHPLVASSMRRLLESHGHSVHLLESLMSHTLIQQAIGFDPQVVIVDRIVGIDDGWTWASNVFRDPSRSPFPCRIIPLTSDHAHTEGQAKVFLKGSDPLLLIRMVEEDW